MTFFTVEDANTGQLDFLSLLFDETYISLHVASFAQGLAIPLFKGFLAAFQ